MPHWHPDADTLTHRLIAEFQQPWHDSWQDATQAVLDTVHS